jgi:hypothetical protein
MEQPQIIKVQELKDIAKTMVADDKGHLLMDESNPTTQTWWVSTPGALRTLRKFPLRKLTLDRPHKR